MRTIWTIALALLVSPLAGCRGEAPSFAGKQGDLAMHVAPDDWARVAGQRIFFGHQSVGENILQGIRELEGSAGSRPVRIFDTTTGPAPQGAVLLHRHVGTNGDPMSKIRGFQEAIDSPLGSDLKVAAVKFCFWDIRADTDVRRVFAEYERTLADLEARHPDIRFVHLTVPLYARDADWRAGLRRLLGRPIPRTLDNAKRHELSQLIRERYSNREPLLDLARIEAAPEAEGGVPYLQADLTTDGGHLNVEGRRRLASAFLHTVALAAAEPHAGSGQ